MELPKFADMYKTILTTLLLAVGCVAASAQTDGTGAEGLRCEIPRLEPDARRANRSTDSTTVELGAGSPFPGTRFITPALMNGYMPWTLHEGFNAQFGLSVTAGFGRNALRGAGFGELAAFAYLLPVGKNGYLAAGVYAANLDWGGRKHTDVGLAALYAHEIGERATVYAYLDKRLAGRDDFQAFRPDFYRTPDFSVGAGMNYKISEKVDIGFSVGFEKYMDNRMPAAPRASALRDYGSPLW